MSKILISGYYGFDNLGDEAILDIMLKRIKKVAPESEITVLSANPEMTQENYGVKAINRKGFFSVIKAVISNDVLISGGGSLLQDVTSKISIYYYLFIIKFAIMCKRKVLIYSQGIGPISKQINRNITSKLLNKVDFITVRESNSKVDLIKMGVLPESVEVTADPVIDMQKVDNKAGHDIIYNLSGQISDEKKTIGFAIRSKDFETTGNYSRLFDLVTQLKKKYNLVFVPFYYNEDIKILEKLRKDFKEEIKIVDKRCSADEVLSIIGNFDVLVGVRLHSLIFAAVQNVPMVAVSYDPKIEYFMESIGLKTTCGVYNFDKSIIEKDIKNIIKNSEEYKEKISSSVELLKKGLELNDRKLNNLL